MKVYTITYQIFEWPYYVNDTYKANIAAIDEAQAVEQLKKELKKNGHRFKRVINIEANDV